MINYYEVCFKAVIGFGNVSASLQIVFAAFVT